MTRVRLSSGRVSKEDPAPCHKAQIVSTRLLEHHKRVQQIQLVSFGIWRNKSFKYGMCRNLQHLCDAIIWVWGNITGGSSQHLVKCMAFKIKVDVKAKGKFWKKVVCNKLVGECPFDYIYFFAFIEAFCLRLFSINCIKLLCTLKFIIALKMLDRSEVEMCWNKISS